MTDRDLEELETEDAEDEDFDPAVNDEWDESFEDDDIADDDELVLEDDDDASDEGDEGDEEDDDSEALDELEAEELDMLTDDEESETLIVDEAEELRAIRRAELSLQSGAASSEKSEDEFVCQSCFLVLKSSQLANKRKMYCRDCAA
ncbi:MAG TPA: DUF4193 family protein [Acidimicrobiia bacterium]|jgi:hypothetical protein|nr:DUF4193 family protein [Acidimicrobiia bacterium]